MFSYPASYIPLAFQNCRSRFLGTKPKYPVHHNVLSWSHVFHPKAYPIDLLTTLTWQRSRYLSSCFQWRKRGIIKWNTAAPKTGRQLFFNWTEAAKRQREPKHRGCRGRGRLAGGSAQKRAALEKSKCSVFCAVLNPAAATPTQKFLQKRNNKCFLGKKQLSPIVIGSRFALNASLPLRSPSEVHNRNTLPHTKPL